MSARPKTRTAKTRSTKSRSTKTRPAKTAPKRRPAAQKTTARKTAARKSAARKSPARKTSARKKTAPKRATSRGPGSAAPARLVSMREAFARLIATPRPQRQVVSCALTPQVSKGHVDFETAYAQSAPATIMLICHGFGFGTGVPVEFTKTATGWSFEGSRPFCHSEECSNGTDALDIVSVTGAIDTTPWVPTMTLTYEVLGYCGAQLVCIETGSFAGKKITTAPDPVNANYQGPSDWTLTCCPVPVWKREVN